MPSGTSGRGGEGLRMENVSNSASRTSVPTLPAMSLPRLFILVGSLRVQVKGLGERVYKGRKADFSGHSTH